MTRKSSGNSGGGSRTTATVTVTPCCSKVGIKRGPWTAEEDEVLAAFVRKEGEGRWRTLPKRAGLARCGKSCRLRWMNYLRPSVKRGHIAADEEDLILRLHRLLGNRWSLIAGRIPGRTDNEIKNYWNTHLSKKLISQGIDPRTHKPFKPESDHHRDTNSAKDNSSSSCKTDDDPRETMSCNNNNKKIKQTHDQYSYGKEIFTQNNKIIQEIASTTTSENNNIVTVDRLSHYHQDDQVINFENDVSVGFKSISNATTSTDQLVLIGATNEEDDLNYCSEDVFSSFLNSLINDDAFPTHSQLPIDPFLSVNTTSSGSNGWESAILSSSAEPLNQINNNEGRPYGPVE